MKNLKFKLSKTVQIKSLSLAIGRSCFMNCPGCYNHFSNKELISQDYILKFVKFVKHNYGLKKITLSGGDPLSRPDIINILSQIKLLGLKINLDTVGVPLLQHEILSDTENKLYSNISPDILIKKIDLLGLPVDGIDNDTIKKFRKGRPNYSEEIFSLLKQLEKYDLKICINTVVHKGNVGTLTKIANKLSKYKNITVWQLFQFSPIGPGGYKHRSEYYIDDNIFIKAVDDLNKYAGKMRLNIVLEPKSINSRHNAYLLVDSGGDVWSPKVVSENSWSIDSKVNKERIIFGNISATYNYSKIMESAVKYLKIS